MEIDKTSPRGSKRKADEPAPRASKRIKALDQDVVNKIAAGEIIVAPVHALKELIENAVDAGSTSVEIVVKDGGLKLLQITDNGHGINRDDMAILCERFTTSKLKTFEDLSAIGTYGFRGEALASISHVAHLTVTTKTVNSSCAWRAHYADGKLIPAKPGQSPDPKPTAGRGGTQITVEDLFYNVPSRQRAFRSPSEEYAKILDVVGRYAVHCTGVAFSCKKHGDSAMGISTPSNASTVGTIRHIYGSAVANELINFEVSDEKWGFKASGWMSNANYHVKKTTLLLFINHRSVESSTIKKAIEQTYSAYLPKGGHPFIYLTLDIEPQRVDVNVHPTKREVNFLNEDEIIECICSDIRTKLSQVDISRTFTTQSLIPTDTRSSTFRETAEPTTAANKSTQQKPAFSTPSRPYENNLVRTDPNIRRITSMLPTSGQETATPSQGGSHTIYSTSPRPRTECRLTTIKHLRATVRSEMHSSLTETFASHTYVGLVDPWRRLVAIQGGVKLFLVDYGLVAQEFFYQLGLADFGNFGCIRFQQPLDIYALINLGVEHEKATVNAGNEGVEWDTVAGHVARRLIERREMLLEYFNFDISAEGELSTIPLLLKGYTPSFAKLPRFLMRLGPCVDWEDEQGCFDTFLHELASFYAPEKLPPYPSKVQSGVEDHGGEDAAMALDDSEEHPDITSRRKEMERVLEHVIFPAVRARLVAVKGLLRGVVEVANLKGLYRVFERC
ncbi:MAG: hypothetical protein Q9163_001949 [Psora crenata]